MKLRLTERAPMMPATAALAAGILLASWRMPPVWVSAAGVAACVAAAAATVRTHRRTASAAIVLAAVFLGAALTALQLRCDPMPGGVTVCEIEIAADAHTRYGSRTRQTDARIIAIRDGGGWSRVRGRLRIYADTTLRLTAGERIVCRGRVRPFGGGDDGYGAAMRRRGYAGGMYLHEDAILGTDSSRISGRLHRRAVGKIGELTLQPENMAVAMAVGTGEASMTGRRQRSEYSRAGMAHLLALSGLHVGIICLMVNMLLAWLPLLRHGNIIRCAAAVVLMWLYVLSTGMPAGAIRAALMFTILQSARAASADYSPLNALSAAAFITLCFDPGSLFDAGFQLSYIAVAAIIFCAMPLYRRLRILPDRRRNPLIRLSAAAVNFITGTTVTGLAATAATAPLVSHLFGVIPLAGILAGPAAIAAAAATVVLTALWILLPLQSAARLFGQAIDLTAGAMNRITELLASWEPSALTVRLTATETVVCYIVAVAVAWAVLSIESRNRQSKNFRIR